MFVFPPLRRSKQYPMDRVAKSRYKAFKKKALQFWDSIANQPLRLVLSLFVSLFFLSLPGQNFYQTAQISAKQPLVRGVDFPLPTIAPYPVKISNTLPPKITAQSAVVMDPDSKVVMFAKNPDLKLSPASLTKIVTALVALENYRLEDILTVGRLYPEGAQMGLFEGEKISVENLLYGLLLPSGNDSAFVLAENFPGGYKEFVRAMNKKVEQLGLKNTRFTNPTGEEDGEHFSTAWDLAHLASHAMSNPLFAKIVGTPHIIVSNHNQTRWHELKNINILLGEKEGVKGVKTGWTKEAGGCFIAYVEKDGQKLVVVVLKSEDEDTRFEETKALINWAFVNHKWQKLEALSTLLLPLPHTPQILRLPQKQRLAVKTLGIFWCPDKLNTHCGW